MTRNANRPNLGTLSILRAGYENNALPARQAPAQRPEAAQDAWLVGLQCRTAESHAAGFARTIREAAAERREARNAGVRAALRAIRENAPTYATADAAARTVA